MGAAKVIQRPSPLHGWHYPGPGDRVHAGIGEEIRVGGQILA
jgi:hypothetical protein